MVTSAQQLEFLQAQAGIRAAVEGRLTALLTNLVTGVTDPREIRDSLTMLTRSMVNQYGQAAADFAADWYNDMRLSDGIPGNFTATGFVQDFDERIDSTVRRALGGLFGESPDVAGFVTAVASKASQYAVDGARNTIVENSYRDPRASGWQRIPFGPTCSFCMTLIGRGGVYKRSTAMFRSHANCDCGAAPSWDLNAVEVPEIAYEASSRMQGLRGRAAAGDKSAQRQLQAYRTRIRSYIASNQAEFADLRQQYNLPPGEPAAH